ncbi:MAG: pilus assembly FimT family protein [Candidatus Nitrosoglobus sp.]
MSQKNFGFTLIEMMVTVAVAAILLTVAIPSFTQMIDKKRLESAAENLYADLQFAQSEAIKRNKTIRVFFYANDSDWCYGLTENLNCNCQETNPTDSDFCEIEGILKTVHDADFKDISFSSNRSSFSFSPLRGAVNTGSAQFQSANNKILQIKVSSFGRFRLCSPSGEGNVAGYPKC